MIDVTRLKDIREDKDITQMEMSYILGVKRPAYSLWELGISIIPFPYLYKFAAYFNISIDYVLGLTSDREIIYYPEFNLKEIGENLKELRLENKIKQKDLAKSLNLSQACIARYEKGLICISTANIYKYSLFFKTPINDLIKTKTHA